MLGFGEDDTEDIKRWRRRAQELRTLATGAANTASHEVYQNLAETYERLAREAESRMARRGKPIAPAKNAAQPPRAAQAGEAPRRGHRFKIGETVSYGAPTGSLIASPELLRIVHRVTAEGSENQYWVKSIADGSERVASEGQLFPLPPGSPSTRKP